MTSLSSESTFVNIYLIYYLNSGFLSIVFWVPRFIFS